MQDPHGGTVVPPSNASPLSAASPTTPLEIDIRSCDTLVIEGAHGVAAPAGPHAVPHWYGRWKPAIEAVVALLLLAASAPLVGLAALLVKLTSRGPAFYTQTRVGKDGRPFTIYKLRTMYRDSETRTGAVWAASGDTRVTLIGKILRATHLDEFPQAINVMLGQMSLIGPRPERPEIVQKLRQRVEGYTERLRVRPGITGLAQVFLPPDVDLEGVRRKLVYDLHYIDNYGAWLDFRIFLCTLLFLLAFPLRFSRRLLRLPDPFSAAVGEGTGGAAARVRMDGAAPTAPYSPPTTAGFTPRTTPSMTESTRPAILYLVHRLPYPPDKGDRIRAFHLLKYLSRRAAVHLACLADEPVDESALTALRRQCARVSVIPLGRWSRWLRGLSSLARGRTVTEGAFDEPAMRDVLRTWTAETRFEAVLASASSMVNYVRLPELRGVPAIIDLVDVDSQKWLDYARADRGPRGWLHRLEGHRLRRCEQDLGAWVRAVTLVSPAEADLYRQCGGAATVRAIPNGVDLTYFQPTPPTDEPSCVFVGALDYRPNVDAACWFCREVWPRIREHYPHARMRLVGRRPVQAVRRLASLAGVEVVGPVPDVRPYLAGAAIAVAPLRIARGVQNKVLEALAMARPCVVSPQALAGIGAVPGTHLLAADSAGEWGEVVLRLLGDGDLRRGLGLAGRQYVETHHHWENCLEPFGALLGLAAAPGREPVVCEELR
jgi:polysaccharide biosynthesis protein PslH